ncbi:MAG: AAA family ATPase [Akkermansia sp.]|nr:AAA family ATPase [Akkermansia sp.]
MEDQEKNNTQQELPLAEKNTVLHYSDMLRASKNIIFHGAPGTGKTYLAHQIAAYIVSQGRTKDWEDLTDKEKEEQVEFVQFHPSYDYTDFVEGLRPTKGKEDGSIGFERKDGIFMEFVKRAQKEDKDSRETEENAREYGARETLEHFLEKCKKSEQELSLRGKGNFKILNYDEKKIWCYNLNETLKEPNVYLSKSDIEQLLASGKNFGQAKDVAEFFNRTNPSREDSYYRAICKAIRKENPNLTPETSQEKKYVFIIDEINRGEISKIFGELFFAIDPDYRGSARGIQTQYANLHSDPNEKFYIPENVYIIGTMNDIDKSVDSFDFAMRRRFRFIELPADENHEMLNTLGDKATEARSRMKALNECIRAEEGLNAYYQIGPAYFLKLKDPGVGFKQLWEDHLEPLLRMYIQGIYCGGKENVLNNFKEAYDR